MVIGFEHAPHNWCENANLVFATWLDNVAACLGKLTRFGKDGSQLIVSMDANTNIAMSSGCYTGDFAFFKEFGDKERCD